MNQMTYSCPGCGKTFQAEEGVKYCPYCASSEVKQMKDPTPEERKKEVEDAARRGYSGT